MITRIELTNFMSHEHTVIEPARGLTVLVGPNNCGKSAVVAALQILCHNEISTYVLRHGERECLVKLETDDGHTIEWRRKTAPSYVIDGKLFDRLRGSGLPDELHRVLRLAKVDAGDDADFDVHFGTQKSPVFLVGSSPANAARFFASSSDAIRLVQMQKRHKEKLQAAQRERNALEAQSRVTNAELAALEPVIDIDGRLKGLDSAYRELQRQSAESDALEAACDALVLQSLVVARHASETSAMSGLAAPPAPLPTADVGELIEELDQSQESLSKAAAQVVALTPLASPPAMGDTTSLEAVCHEIERLQRAISEYSGEHQALGQLVLPPVLTDTSALESIARQLESATLARDRSGERLGVLQAVSAPPALLDEEPLANVIDSLVAAGTQVGQGQEQVAAISGLALPPTTVDTSPLEVLISQLDAATTQLRNRAAEFEAASAARAEAERALREEASESVCPICGGPLDADRLLMGSAAGQDKHCHG